MKFETIEDANNFIKKQEKEIKELNSKLETSANNEKLLQEQAKQIEEFKQIEAKSKEDLAKQAKNNKFKALGFDEKHFDKLAKLTNEIEIEKLEEALKEEDYKIFMKTDGFNVKINDEEASKEKGKEEKPLSVEEYLKSQNLLQ